MLKIRLIHSLLTSITVLILLYVFIQDNFGLKENIYARSRYKIVDQKSDYNFDVLIDAKTRKNILNASVTIKKKEGSSIVKYYNMDVHGSIKAKDTHQLSIKIKDIDVYEGKNKENSEPLNEHLNYMLNSKLNHVNIIHHSDKYIVIKTAPPTGEHILALYKY